MRLPSAISDPTNTQALDQIKFQTGLIVEPVIVQHDALLQLLEQFGQHAEQSLSDLIGDDLDINFLEDDTAATAEAVGTEVDDAPVVKFLQKILIDAINLGASDIHFEPFEKFYRIRFRVDGILREVTQPPLSIKEKLASRIKVISRLDISEKRVPQDGRMKLVISKTRAIDFRVSTLPTLFGEKIVMRILDASQAQMGIDALGYDADQKEILLNAIQRPENCRVRQRTKTPASDHRSQFEDRQVHRNHQAADQHSENHHDQRFHQAGKRSYCIIDFFFVKIGDLAQHHVERAGFLADRYHLRDHVRKYV
jgi:type IV pilus assembly protein PilB